MIGAEDMDMVWKGKWESENEDSDGSISGAYTFINSGGLALMIEHLDSVDILHEPFSWDSGLKIMCGLLRIVENKKRLVDHGVIEVLSRQLHSHSKEQIVELLKRGTICYMLNVFSSLTSVPKDGAISLSMHALLDMKQASMQAIRDVVDFNIVTSVNAMVEYVLMDFKAVGCECVDIDANKAGDSFNTWQDYIILNVSTLLNNLAIGEVPFPHNFVSAKDESQIESLAIEQIRIMTSILAKCGYVDVKVQICGAIAKTFSNWCAQGEEGEDDFFSMTLPELMLEIPFFIPTIVGVLENAVVVGASVGAMRDEAARSNRAVLVCSGPSPQKATPRCASWQFSSRASLSSLCQPICQSSAT